MIRFRLLAVPTGLYVLLFLTHGLNAQEDLILEDV